MKLNFCLQEENSYVSQSYCVFQNIKFAFYWKHKYKNQKLTWNWTIPIIIPRGICVLESILYIFVVLTAETAIGEVCV